MIVKYLWPMNLLHIHLLSIEYILLSIDISKTLLIFLTE